jgi:hypothetical protein
LGGPDEEERESGKDQETCEGFQIHR